MPRDDNEPIHSYFGLSYCNYLVMPRTVLQSMPLEWQRRFIALLDEYDRATRDLDDSVPEYIVSLADGCSDPYADYERGRRRVPLNPISRKNK